MQVSSLPMKSRTRLADDVFDTFVTRTLRPLSTASLMQTAGHKNGSTHSQPQTSFTHRIAVCIFFIPFLLILIRPLMLLRFNSHFGSIPILPFSGLFYLLTQLPKATLPKGCQRDS